MRYDIPGGDEIVGEELVAWWNETITAAYAAQIDLHSRFFEIDPTALPDITDHVAWPANPLEPTFCLPDEVVHTLCDRGLRGRHVLHSEYCEYSIVRAADANGHARPKRVQVTTELREYWLTLAMHDPEQVLAAATDSLGREPSWQQLYGETDPLRLSKAERRLRFATQTAGHGNEEDLKQAGVPRDPAGTINNENALFMTHPINGLDDLLFIVLFGARRFAVREHGGNLRRAERNDILAGERCQLACRHADPAAALAAYQVVLAAKKVGFANPLGMYIRPFNHRVLEFAGEPIPDSWVRWGRGRDGAFQRLELGPADEDDAFLDDIEVPVGQERQRLIGGYQLLRMIEVGPLLATAPTEPASRKEFELIPPGEPIVCRQTGICDSVDALLSER